MFYLRWYIIITWMSLFRNDFFIWDNIFFPLKLEFITQMESRQMKQEERKWVIYIGYKCHVFMEETSHAYTDYKYFKNCVIFFDMYIWRPITGIATLPVRHCLPTQGLFIVYPSIVYCWLKCPAASNAALVASHDSQVVCWQCILFCYLWNKFKIHINKERVNRTSNGSYILCFLLRTEIKFIT